MNLVFAAFESYPMSTSNMALGRLKLNSMGNMIDIINEPSSIINFSGKGAEANWSKPFQINELQQTAFVTRFMYKDRGFTLERGGKNLNLMKLPIYSVR